MSAQVTPEMFARVFDGLPEGKLIYEHLVARFCRNPYVKGGQEADRQTAYNAGQMSVPAYITSMINRANGFNEPEQTEDSPS